MLSVSCWVLFFWNAVNRYFIEDCRNVMRRLQDASVDVVIADPPYGETRLAWDVWPKGWLDELPRVMKPSASLWVFGSFRMFMDHVAEFDGWNIAQEVIWEKHNGSNSHADRFRKVHETIVQFYHRHHKWGEVFKNPLHSTDAVARQVRRQQNPQHWGQIGASFYQSQNGGKRLMRSVWCCRSTHGAAIHPTQKPEGIIAPLIEYSCPQGGGGARAVFGKWRRGGCRCEARPALDCDRGGSGVCESARAEQCSRKV